MDQAPDPPGWGDAVREAWREHRWAPWRLPAGVEPLPVRTEPVEGAMRAFATREEGLARVLELVHGARERLSVATYLFTNDVVADALAAAARRGVEVTLLVEATPVGGLPESERRILARLSEAGVEVRRFGGPVADHGLQHAKVVVADGSVLLVLTENLTYTGLPPDGDGNLGLGLGVANATLARRVEARLGFAGSSEPWTPDGWREARARVAVVTSPENAWRPNATGWLSSTGRVDGLALQVGPEWGPRRNGWLVDLVEASREHPVRVLASGVPEHAREENRLGLSFLTAHPSAGAIEARLSDPDQGRVHAKALIGSGTVLVGSSNWGLGGVLLNREVNLLVHDGPTAQRFQGIFDAAWNGTGREQGYALPSPGFEVALLGVGIAVLAGRGWGRGRIRRSG